MIAYLEAVAWKAHWQLQETAEAVRSKANSILRDKSGAIAPEYVVTLTGIAIVAAAVMAGSKSTVLSLLAKAEASLNAVNP